MTVYAIYEKNEEPEPQPEEKTVTFIADGETVKEVSVVKGEVIGTQLPTAPTKGGYTFKDWNTQEDGKGEAVTEKTVVDADMTVYAIYEKVQKPIKPTPGDKPDNKPNNKPVKTGDNTNMAVPFTLMATAVLVIGTVVFCKKRKTK